MNCQNDYNALSCVQTNIVERSTLKKPILLHIPKTGGTTLFLAVTGATVPLKPNALYRHVQLNVDRTEMVSNSGDIFDGSAHKKYPGHKYIVISRDPLERLESEFGFFGTRNIFRDVWKRKIGSNFPTSLLEYISHQATSNSICKFLLGYDLYGKDSIDEQKERQIISTFDNLEFVFGLMNEMSLSFKNVEHQCKMKFNRTLPRFRSALYKKVRDNSWQEIEDKFNEMNPHDLAIHNAIAQRFYDQTASLPKGNDFIFKGDKYDAIYQFMSGEDFRSPLEIFASDLQNSSELYNWAREQKDTIASLRDTLLPKHRGNGKSFLLDWIECSHLQDLAANDIELNKEDPLETIRSLVRVLFQKQ